MYRDFEYPDENLAEKVLAIREEIKDEYRKHHEHPWVVAFSGGKDSTLLLQLVIDAILELPPSKRKRRVYVVSNDTLVESPLVITHLKKVVARISNGMEALDLPVTVHVTAPKPDQTFWVNLIGRGYPPPSRMFRWCTDRMKIRPTSAFIKETVSQTGQCILLLGVRSDESTTRARSVEKHTVRDDEGKAERLNPHSDLKGCMVFRPIVGLTTEEVWTVLLQTRPAWGGTHRELVTLYRNAQGGGECPLVIDKAQEPSCGTGSPRFGCWTCTVVSKDRSMEGWIDSGFDHLEPLNDFRVWLKEIEHDSSRRQLERRNGTISWIYDEGGNIAGHNHGPFTIAARQEILTKLLEVQEKVGAPLISEDEIREIRNVWGSDAIGICDRFLALCKSADPR